jgi:hypothetical protein
MTVLPAAGAVHELVPEQHVAEIFGEDDPIRLSHTYSRILARPVRVGAPHSTPPVKNS